MAVFLPAESVCEMLSGSGLLKNGEIDLDHPTLSETDGFIWTNRDFRLS